jgi:hypothetical protein
MPLWTRHWQKQIVGWFPIPQVQHFLVLTIRSLKPWIKTWRITTMDISDLELAPTSQFSLPHQS